MASEATERLLNEIGQRLAQEAGHPLASILLYAEFDTNMVGYGMFIDCGNHIAFLSPEDSFADPLLDLWKEENPAKRWAEMEYVLRNGKFAVTFVYPGQFDPEEDLFERGQRAIERHFGSKPVIYPPLLDDDVQRFDL